MRQKITTMHPNAKQKRRFDAESKLREKMDLAPLSYIIFSNRADGLS